MRGQHAGISWIRISDEIKRFVRKHGNEVPRRALFCTFDIHVERFNSVIFPLLDQGRRPFQTMVLADAGALQARLSHGQPTSFGRYQLMPVRCMTGGVFHPKLVVLRAGKWILVGVGSSNLTSGGLGGNLELMLFVKGNIETREQPLIAGSANFLSRLVDPTTAAVIMPERARDFVGTLVDNVSIDDEKDTLLHTLDEPLIDQMRRLVGGNVTDLRVVSPWHSAGEGIDGLDSQMAIQLSKHFSAPLTVYTGGQGGKAPKLGPNVQVRIRRDSTIDSTEQEYDGDSPEVALSARRIPVEVHAKAYLFEARRNVGFLFFGSANCTQPALCRTVKHGGNVELLVGCHVRPTDLQTWRSDLDNLFLEAQRSVLIKPVKPLAKVSGRILSGEALLSESEGPERLILELVGDGVGTISVSASPEGRSSVSFSLEGSKVVIDDIKVLRKLLVSERFNAENGVFGSVLYERVGIKWVAFPVCVPVFGSISSDPTDVLEELVLQEIGQWRNSRPGKVRPNDTDIVDAPNSDDDIDKDKHDLAIAQHQGELDRIAVSVAILKRRLAHENSGQGRLAILEKQLKMAGLQTHLLGIVSTYLRTGGKA